MPWIVRNLLRGTLTFKGIGLSIPPKGQVDLDVCLGRGPAESSNQVQVAFEEGYLQTVRKDDASGGGAAGLSDEAAEKFRAQLREEYGALRAVAGDIRGMLEAARLRIREQRELVIEDESLTEAEIRARLACLDEQERELEKNFSEIGRKTAAVGPGGVAEKADLLSSM